MSEVPSHRKDMKEDYGEQLQDSTDKEKDSTNLDRRITKDMKSLRGLQWIEDRRWNERVFKRLLDETEVKRTPCSS